MKKNTKTFLLLAVVLGVWGVIGFKLLNAANPTAPNQILLASNDTFVPAQLKQRDTFSIVANYRDPFLGTVKAPKKIVKSAPKVQKERPPEKSIQYTGFITDASSKQKIFFVTIEGQQQMMSINDVFSDVKLVHGTKGKIKVRHNGKTRSITLTE